MFAELNFPGFDPAWSDLVMDLLAGRKKKRIYEHEITATHIKADCYGLDKAPANPNQTVN